MQIVRPRHRIQVGTRFRFPRTVRSGVDLMKNPYWLVPMAMNQVKNGEINTFDWYWLKGSGRCEFTSGEWVEITNIKSVSSSANKNEYGGTSIFRVIECDFKKAQYDNKGVDNE